MKWEVFGVWQFLVTPQFVYWVNIGLLGDFGWARWVLWHVFSSWGKKNTVYQKVMTTSVSCILTMTLVFKICHACLLSPGMQIWICGLMNIVKKRQSTEESEKIGSNGSGIINPLFHRIVKCDNRLQRSNPMQMCSSHWESSHECKSTNDSSKRCLTMNSH